MTSNQYAAIIIGSGHMDLGWCKINKAPFFNEAGDDPIWEPQYTLRT